MTATATETATATATVTAPITVTPKQQEIINKVFEKTKNGTLAQVAGGLGDMEFCEAFVEEVLRPPEGGTFVKFFGCDFLFKGFPEVNIVEGLAMSKALISLLPRKILAKSLILKTALILLYIFSRKRFWHYIHIYFYSLYLNTVTKSQLSLKRYNRPALEILRSVDAAIKEVMDKMKIYTGFELTHGAVDLIDEREFFEAMACASRFTVLFLEYDNAYRFRFQDILSEIKKNNTKKNVIKEVKRLINLLIEREDKIHGIRVKWRELKRIIILFLYISKKFRLFVKEFLLNLNIDQIKLDQDDWYFCLKRRSYAFKGMSLAKRLKIRKQIDEEKGHLFLQLVTITDPAVNNGQPTQVFRFIHT